MKLNNYFMAGAAVLALFATGCSKDGENPDKVDDKPGGSGSMEQMDPEAAKSYITSTAVEFMDLLNPADQKDFIDMAAYMDVTLGDLDLPDEFDIEDEEDDEDSSNGVYARPDEYTNAIAKAMRGDLNELTRAAYTYTYNINFDRFKGRYEPDFRKGRWTKTADSNDIAFAYTDAEGQKCQLRIEQADGTSDLTISTDYTGYDYTETDIYNISIPKTVTAELKRGESVIASSKVVSSIDVAGHKLSADAEISTGNLRAVVRINGEDSKISSTSTFYVNGKEAGNATAVINGSHLCDKDQIEAWIESENPDDYFATMINDGAASVNCLGKVQVYAQATYSKNVFELLDEEWDSDTYTSKTQARNACQTACDLINETIKAQMRFDNKATDQATLTFVPGIDEWDEWGESNWEYFCAPRIYFPQDESSLDIDSYFSKFNTVESKFNVLKDSYERAWRNAIKKYEK